MAMTMNELMQAMEKIGSNGTSQLHMRSEDLQTKQRVSRITTLKNAIKKKSKLLLETEIALPFNPQTGQADDVFNSKNKYRPPFSATTTALALKELADSNEALKETLMSRVGVSEWDTSDHETFTDDDWVIFNKYRVPRIFSLSVTHVDIQAMNTGKYGRDYAVSVQRDSQGEVVGEIPAFLAANKFFRDRAYEEVKAYNATIESGECKDDDKAQKDHRGKIYGRVPVSDDKPANYVRLFELPLDTSYELVDSVDLDGVTAQSIKDYEVISRYKKGIRQAVESYKEGGWKKFDKSFDFFDIEMTCPTEGDDSTDQGKAKIGQDTKFDKPTTTLFDQDVYVKKGVDTTQKLRKAISEYIDSDLNVEERVRQSMRIPVYTEAVEDQILSSLRTVIDLDGDEFITQEVIKNNADFLKEALGDEADEKLEEIDAGISDKKEGQLDSDDAKKEAKSYDLNSGDFADDLDEVDLDVD